MPTVYATEDVRDLWSDLWPLLREHYKRVAHYEDIPLNPSVEQYNALQDVGMLRCYTAREDGELIGYAVFFVRPHIHYADSLMAAQDVLFHKRGALGLRGLVKFADQQLRGEGVQLVSHHIKAAHDFGAILERQGYELMDLIYVKRLDKE